MSFRKLVLCTVLLQLVIYYAESARILGLFPMASYSHHTLGVRLMNELVARGHDVTFLSPYKKNENDKYTNIELTGFPESIEELKKNMNLYEMNSNAIIGLLVIHWMGQTITEQVFEHPNTKKLIQSNDKYDVVIIEQFVNDALKGFCHHFNASCILLNPVATNYWSNVLTGNPSNPSYISEMLLNHAGPMDFLTRVKNAALSLYAQVALNLYIIPQQNKLMQKHFPSAPPLQEIMYNPPLILLNSHITTAPAVPLLPNMIEIGGYHVKPAKKLPQDLQSYLDDAKEGVVYFSMGSNLKSDELPEEKKAAVLKALGQLKYKVLWKFETDLPNKPKNVKISKWLPQQDILAHPNIKLFITHGGLLSTIEAIYHGVPVLGIPVFGDQSSNMQLAEHQGYGIKLPFSELCETRLTQALKELLTNPKYAKNAKLRSKLFHDRPIKPLDEAMYWIDYVIRHKNSEHFRSAALDLCWYQYLLLDVLAFIALGSIVAAILFSFVVKYLCCRNKTKSIEKTKTSKQKKNK